MLNAMTQPMFNIFSRDVDKQIDFYQALLGWEEIKEYSSPIYRVLTGAGIQLAFNGVKAYELMGLGSRAQIDSVDFPISTMFTSVVQDPALVDQVAQAVSSLGGSIVKGPFPTYYGHWQVVFCDPEGNVARVTSTNLPSGAVVPVVEFDEAV